MSNLSDFVGGKKVGDILYADSATELPGGIEQWLPLDGARYSSSAYPLRFVNQPYLFRVDANVIPLDKNLVGSFIWFKAYRIDERRLVFIPNTSTVEYLIGVDIVTGENRKITLPSVGAWHASGGWVDSGAYICGAGTFLIKSDYSLEKISSNSFSPRMLEFDSVYLGANNTVVSGVSAISVEIIDKKTKAIKSFNILSSSLTGVFSLNSNVFIVWTGIKFCFYDLDGNLLKTLSSSNSSMHKLSDGTVLITNYPNAQSYSIVHGYDEIEPVVSLFSVPTGFSNKSISFFGCGDTVIVDGLKATYFDEYKVVASYTDKSSIIWAGVRKKMSYFVMTVDGILRLISINNGQATPLDLLSTGVFVSYCIELNNRYIVATSNNAGQKTYVLIDLESLSFFNTPSLFNLFARIR